MDTIFSSLSDILWFVFVLGVLITIHEFGHFIAARLSGMRVDIFSVGMGPRVLGWNRRYGFSFGKLTTEDQLEGDTDYRLAAFPLGGYVKIAGMIDESFDTEHLAEAPKPWEFRSKNAFQKGITISAGVIMNYILAILIFAGIALYHGRLIIPSTQAGYIPKGSVSHEIGIQTGDIVQSVNGKKPSTFDEVIELLTIGDLGEDLSVSIRRGSTDTVLTYSGKTLMAKLADKVPLGFNSAAFVVYLAGVEDNGPASKAGLRTGDTVVSINGIPIDAPQRMVDLLKPNPNTAFTISVKRGSSIEQVTATTNDMGQLRVQPAAFANGTNVDYTVAGALSVGWDRSWTTVELFFTSIAQILRGKIAAKDSLGGPVKIFQMVAENAERGFTDVLILMASLSVTLAVINILPFPVLDGGHLVIIIIEGVARRELPTKIKLWAQQIGVVILLLFMAFTIFNDITR